MSIYSSEFRKQVKAAQKNFRDQRGNALSRGIIWDLDFEQWLSWWLDTGHYHERGKKRGQYCMSRYNDEGPYAIGNIFCQLASTNIGDARRAEAARRKNKNHRIITPPPVSLADVRYYKIAKSPYVYARYTVCDKVFRRSTKRLTEEEARLVVSGWLAEICRSHEQYAQV